MTIKVGWYFYLNKISCYRKGGFVVHKLADGAGDWWQDVLVNKARADKPIILSS